MVYNAASWCGLIWEEFNVNNISRGIREVVVTPDSSPIRFMDYFVDGRSLEAHLRETFPGMFSKGRFREIQVPTLAGAPDDASLREAVAENILPPDNQSRTCLIYCCLDGCCQYCYVQVHRRGGVVVWERFGVNATFAFQLEGAEEGIAWLANFQPLSFSLDEYSDMICAFRER